MKIRIFVFITENKKLCEEQRLPICQTYLTRLLYNFRKLIYFYAWQLDSSALGRQNN